MKRPDDDRVLAWPVDPAAGADGGESDFETGPEAQFFRAALRHASAETGAPAADWEAIARRLDGAPRRVLPDDGDLGPGLPWWISPVRRVAAMAAPMVIASVVGLTLFPINPTTGPIPRGAVSPAAVIDRASRDDAVVIRPDPIARLRALGIRGFARIDASEAPRPTRDDRGLPVVASRSAWAAPVAPSDLLPGEQRDERINPFLERPTQPVEADTPVPLRPGHFRFTSV